MSRPQEAIPETIPAQGNVVELVRRFNKALLVARSLGGLLPGLDSADLVQVSDVLEVGSGPGGWLLEMGRTYPDMQITGVETNVRMIDYARTLANEQRLANVFCQHTARFSDPFAFPDESFDLVSIQFISHFLTPGMWPFFLRECLRVLRPGGKLRITEFEMGMANSPAYEELVSLYIRAQMRAYRTFSPTERHLGLLCELEPLVQEAGFLDTRPLAHAINFSYGMHTEWSIDFLIQSRLIQPFLVEMGVASQAQIDELHRQQQLDMRLPTFHALLQLLTVWGSKQNSPATIA